MSLTAPNTPTLPNEQDETLANYPFFPDVSLLDFRNTMRVDSVVSSERAKTALENAIIDTNLRLTTWIKAMEDMGHTSISDVPPPFGMPPNTNQSLYLRAVYSLAKADITEKYRDYDATGEAFDQGESLNESIEEHRRNAHWAINDLMGKPRATVALL